MRIRDRGNRGGLGMTGNCLICGRWGERLDSHHWPHSIGSGRKRERVEGLLMVPVCRVCHSECHSGHHTELLIERAPRHWTSQGLDYEGTLEVWCGMRRLK